MSDSIKVLHVLAQTLIMEEIRQAKSFKFSPVKPAASSNHHYSIGVVASFKDWDTFEISLCNPVFHDLVLSKNTLNDFDIIFKPRHLFDFVSFRAFNHSTGSYSRLFARLDDKKETIRFYWYPSETLGSFTGCSYNIPTLLSVFSEGGNGLLLMNDVSIPASIGLNLLKTLGLNHV